MVVENDQLQMWKHNLIPFLMKVGKDMGKLKVTTRITGRLHQASN